MSVEHDGRLDPERLPRFAAELAEQLERGLQLGGQVRVLLRGEEVADAAFGEARPGEPMTRRHRMLWLSSSKPVAALAVLRLWEAGDLALDQPVAELVPGFGRGGKEGVTVRHLLTHTAGIRMVDVGWPARSWEEILEGIGARRIEPGWVPGRRAGYHTESSWFVLGEIVRRLDGRPFDEYVREEIFEPIGCLRCSIGLAADRYRGTLPELAPVFERMAGGPLDLGWTAEERVVRPSPGANGWGPIAELARLYELLAAGGALGGRRLLSPQAVEAMTARHRVGLFDRTFRTRLDWGLGVIVNSAHYGDPDLPYGYGPFAGARAFGHSGARSSTAFVDPDAGLVVAFAANLLVEAETHRERLDALLGALYQDLGLATVMEYGR